MDFYVYLHKKKSTGEVFYVGKGSGNRAWSYSGRSALWNRTANKHGILVEIVQKDLQEWYAYELERDLIAYYGRYDLKYGKLVNFSDGGVGGTTHSEITKQKLRYKLGGLNSYKADQEIYTFFNIETKESVVSKRIPFEKNFNIKIGRLFNTSKYGVSFPIHKNWVVLDLLPDGINPQEIEKRTFEGVKNPNVDKEIHEFINVHTEEIFIGTRLEAKQYLQINTNILFFNNGTVNGWALTKGRTKNDIENLRNPHAISAEKRRNKAVINFKNKDGRVFIGDRKEFKSEVGFDPNHLLSEKHKSLVQKGWYLLENEAEVFKSKRNKTLYTFIHKDHGMKTCTREDLERDFNLDSRPLFTSKKNRLSVKGWSLAAPN